MRVFKPLQGSVLYKTFEWKGKQRFAVSLLFGFSFDGGDSLLEPDLWQFIPGEIGKDGVLDLCMPKPNGEALLYGKYFAPGRTPVTADSVRFKIGPIDKTLQVIGDRYWRVVLGPSAPEPFRVMPLDYTRAFGGAGFNKNPIGRGMVEVDVFGEKRKPLPNIEYPDRLMTSPGQRPDPVGFAPLDAAWEFRASKLGTYDEKWLKERAPAYPDDLDWNHFNAAPPDQWIDGFFNGDEAFELVNMHPDKPLVKGKLPGYRARCLVERELGGETRVDEMALRAETVWLFPHAERGIVLYRGAIDIQTDDGSDLKHLIAGYENLADPPREKSHYVDALNKRIDPETENDYLLYTLDLIPNGARCGYAALTGQDTDMGAMVDNQRAKGERLKEAVAAQVEGQKVQLAQTLQAQGVDPAPVLAEFDKAAKPELDVKVADIDMKKAAELAAGAKETAAEQKAAAREQLVATSRRLAATPGAEQEKAIVDRQIQEFDLPPLLPRPPGHEALQRLEAQKEQVERLRGILRSQGIHENELPSFDIDIDAVRAGMEQARRGMKEGYRMSAHLLEKGRPPHQAPLNAIREGLLEKIAANQSVAGGDFAGLDLSDRDLSGVDFSHCFLEGVNLSRSKLVGANLEGAILAFANLSRCDFSGANLRRANIGAANLAHAIAEGADLSEAVLGKSDLTDAKLIECNFASTDLSHAILSGADLSRSTLPGIAFSDLHMSRVKCHQAVLTECTFSNCDLRGSDFTSAVLHGATWVETKLDGANFTDAQMTDTRFPGGTSLRGARFVRAQMESSNLRETDLREADFTEAGLVMCDFGDANAQKAVFTRSVAKLAQFIGTDLGGADLSSMNLMEGTLMKARLTSASLRHANCYGVEFMKATVGGTDFSGANLDGTKLEHWRPSR